MKKELEALNGIKKVLAKYISEKTGVSEEKHFEYLQYDTEIDIIAKALTPPTADEVCKALSMEYKNHVMFEVDYKQFIVTMTRPIVMQYEITEYKNGCVRIQPDYLKPHLITLIGRFYQGLEVGE